MSNPLAVMALLYEWPMHSYEGVSTIRERGKHESVGLRYGSLYSVVGAEHELVLWEAGLSLVRELAREAEDGTLGGMRQWWSFRSEPEAMVSNGKGRGATDELT